MFLAVARASLDDSGEKPMLDLVPFAGTGWVVADNDVQSGGGGAPGKFEFQSQGAMAIRSSAVGGDEDAACIGMLVLAHLFATIFRW
jgi:hypothetical protein